MVGDANYPLKRAHNEIFQCVKGGGAKRSNRYIAYYCLISTEASLMLADAPSPIGHWISDRTTGSSWDYTWSWDNKSDFS